MSAELEKSSGRKTIAKIGQTWEYSSAYTHIEGKISGGATISSGLDSVDYPLND